MLRDEHAGEALSGELGGHLHEPVGVSMSAESTAIVTPPEAVVDNDDRAVAEYRGQLSGECTLTRATVSSDDQGSFVGDDLVRERVVHIATEGSVV